MGVGVSLMSTVSMMVNWMLFPVSMYIICCLSSITKSTMLIGRRGFTLSGFAATKLL